jgi:hypothetical protein
MKGCEGGMLPPMLFLSLCDDDLQKEWAKFGYKPSAKVVILKDPSMFGATYYSLMFCFSNLIHK